jgi:hypothetical protein
MERLLHTQKKLENTLLELQVRGDIYMQQQPLNNGVMFGL